MRVFKRGKVYYCYVYEAGRRVQRSTRCHDRTAAEKVARQFERDAADPDHARTSAATLSSAIASHRAMFQELIDAGRRSAETLDSYRWKMGHLIAHLEGDPEAGTYRPFALSGLRQHHVDQFVTKRRGEGSGDRTISKELRCLFAVLAHAKRAGLWKGDVEELMPPGFEPEYKPKTRWLAMAEVQALLGALLPDRAARVALTIATGACKSEAAHVRREDVDLTGNRVLLRGTKRPSRWRTVVLALAWQKELLTYALATGEGADGLLFKPWGNIWTDIAQACDSVGIPRASTNDLRRSYAHWMRAEGVTLETLAPLMGHTTTAMVQKVYGKLDAGEIALRLHAELGARCITGASPASDPDGFTGTGGRKNRGKSRDRAAAHTSTPGLRTPARLWPKARKYRSKTWETRAAASPVHQPAAPARKAKSRK